MGGDEQTWQQALAELLSAGAAVLRELGTQVREENEAARARRQRELERERGQL